MALTTNQAIADQVYLAYFSRPTDTGTLTNFGAGLSSGSPTLAQMQSLFSSAEGVSVYGSAPTVSSVVAKAFELVGRTATASDLNAWNSWAVSANLNIAQLPWEVMKVALATEKDLPQASQIAWARLAVSYQLAEDLSANATTVQNLAQSTTTQAAARAVITGVTSFATIATAYPASGAGTASTFVSGASSATGTTFTLTTGIDQGTAFTGTSNNDTFVAIADGGGTTDTLTAADVIDGGAGTSDTLNITAIGTALADVTQGATISNIEVIALRNTVATGVIMGFSATGLTGVTMSGIGDTTVTNIATGVALTTSSTGAAILSQEYVAAATSAVTNIVGGSALGTVTYVGAGLTGVTINTTGTADSTAGAIDVAGAAAININAASKLTATSIATTSTAGVITVTGAAVASIGTLDTGVTTVTASGTGGVTTTLSAAAQVLTLAGTGVNTVTTGGIVLTGTVTAGAGTADKLIVSAAADIAATPGAKYTGFEILNNTAGGATLNVSPVVGITSIQLGATGQGAAGMNATQAAAVTNLTNNDTLTLALTTATGTADALTVTLANATATTSADLTTATVTGFETMNVVSSSGTSADINALTFAAAGNLTALNLSGAKPISVTTTNITSVVAISAANLTYAGSTATDYALTITGATASGSSVTGSAAADSITVSSTIGTTYNAGAGNDKITAAVADLVADGVGGDHAINGGDGTDTLSISDAAATFLDNHTTYLTNMEKITMTGTGDTSITLAAGFNAAFTNGVTITSGALLATKDLQLAAGLANKAITLTVDATANTGAATETYSLVTGSGADTVTFTGDAGWVGVSGAAAQGTIAISTGAGADTISVTVGDLVSGDVGATTGQAISVTGGTGADLITITGKANGAAANSLLGNALFTVAAGDSTTTSYDQITGFIAATAADVSDGLAFDGAGAVGTLATSIDAGTIQSHSVTAGVVLFSTAAAYSSASVINATNLADAVAYLVANSATNDIFAFAYDRDASGTAESTMVFHNGTTDSLVLLVGTTGVDAIITTNAAGANDLFAS